MNEVFEGGSVLSVDKLLPVLERSRIAPPRIVVSGEKVVPLGVILAVDVDLERGASVILVLSLEDPADAAILVSSKPSNAMLLEV